jgi:hypothetical protein
MRDQAIRYPASADRPVTSYAGVMVKVGITTSSPALVLTSSGLYRPIQAFIPFKCHVHHVGAD